MSVLPRRDLSASMKEGPDPDAEVAREQRVFNVAARLQFDLAYRTVLTLHTFGMMVLAGAALMIDLRLLGFGRAIPLHVSRRRRQAADPR